LGIPPIKNVWNHTAKTVFYSLLKKYSSWHIEVFGLDFNFPKIFILLSENSLLSPTTNILPKERNQIQATVYRNELILLNGN
jgi:hypothetical protein